MSETQTTETTEAVATATAAEETAERARQAAQGRMVQAQAALEQAKGRINEADEVIAGVTARIACCDPDDDEALASLAAERGRAQARREALTTQRDARAKVAGERFDDLKAATLAADEARHARLAAYARAIWDELDKFIGTAFEHIGATLHAVEIQILEAHRLRRDIATRQGQRPPDVMDRHGTCGRGGGWSAAERIEDRLSKALAKRRT